MLLQSAVAADLRAGVQAKAGTEAMQRAIGQRAPPTLGDFAAARTPDIDSSL